MQGRHGSIWILVGILFLVLGMWFNTGPAHCYTAQERTMSITRAASKSQGITLAPRVYVRHASFDLTQRELEKRNGFRSGSPSSKSRGHIVTYSYRKKREPFWIKHPGGVGAVVAGVVFLLYLGSRWAVSPLKKASLGGAAGAQARMEKMGITTAGASRCGHCGSDPGIFSTCRGCGAPNKV